MGLVVFKQRLWFVLSCRLIHIRDLKDLLTNKKNGKLFQPHSFQLVECVCVNLGTDMKLKPFVHNVDVKLCMKNTSTE